MTEILRLAPDVIVFDRKIEKSFTSVDFKLKVVDWQEVDLMVRHGSLLINDEEARSVIAETDFISKENILKERSSRPPDDDRVFARRQWQYRRYLSQKIGEKDPLDYSALQWMTKDLAQSEERHVFENGMRLEIPEIDFIPGAVLEVHQVSGDTFYYKFPNIVSENNIRLMVQVPSDKIQSGKYKVMTPSDIRNAFELYGAVNGLTYSWVLADSIIKMQ